MKKFYLLFLLVLPAMAWCGPVQVKIQINGKRAICVLQTPESSYQVQPDSTGLAIILLPETTRKGYGILFHGTNRYPLYFNQQSFDMTITPDDKALNPVFAGPGSAINTYLNTPPLARWNPDYKPEEAEFAIALDKEEKKLIRNLDSCQLDVDFTRWERERLHYMVQGRWGLYPFFHKYAIKGEGKIPDPTDVYYQSLQKLIVEDEDLLKLVDYRLALSDVVHFIPIRGAMNAPELDKLKLKLDFVEKNFKNPVIISHVVNEMITRYVQSQGVETLAYFGPIHNQKVIDESAKKAFNALCLKMGNVAIGHVSPDFCYPDIDGKEVSLKDLAGKYVYIDVWATWCGPCKAQIPALKELEKRYAGKDIHFVSMSNDANKKAWEKMVKAEQLTGIQLIMNDDQKFMKAYMIEGIPRFILLDKEGKIIQPDMSRPSDPKTVEALDKLLN